MPEKPPNHYQHFLVKDRVKKERFTTPRSGRGKGVPIALRDKKSHGQSLKEQLQKIEEATQQNLATTLKDQGGITIEFEAEPGYELKLESLENLRSGIELVNVRKEQIIDANGNKTEITIATVYVPEGKLEHFLHQVEQYLQEVTKKGNPKHQSLLANINNIKIASLKAFWTDSNNFPNVEQKLWWEVWLRAGDNKKERNNIYSLFGTEAGKISIRVSKETLKFPERTVLLAFGSADDLTKSNALINCLAELRTPREAIAATTSEDFTSLSPREQKEYIEELLRRINLIKTNWPAVCILDTGINQNHPLIKIALEEKDLDSYNRDWGNNDHQGHGSKMAGTVLYGDLTDILSNNKPIEIRHKLESVKMLPPQGQNDPLLYGDINKQCIAITEIKAPNQPRLFCLAVTTNNYSGLGKPSSWSSAIDQSCIGIDEVDEETPLSSRLILISAGNITREEMKDYPVANQTSTIHDPAQAWNALTVGGYTTKSHINNNIHPSLSLLAPINSLSPHSSTSLMWGKEWPIKPEIVLEAGNVGINKQLNEIEFLESLSLLSTSKYSYDFQKLLTTTEATSAATGLACRMAAIVMSRYPEFWPETVRGLLVHSADWTKEMCNNEDPWKKTKANIEKDLLRLYGFGVPDLEKALWSAKNSLTLIAQETIQPFFKEGSEIKTREMDLHELPWPRDVLLLLGEVEVKMRVTLSYFIEPNPGERGWNKNFTYASYGLRFDTKKPTESVEEFRKRINKIAREEDQNYQKNTSGYSDQWLLGQNLRKKGSIHSDTWKGTAADLAEQGYVAIYPKSGWWKERKRLERWNNQLRYSLIVTISTEKTDVDIYTPIMNLITV